MNESFQLYGPGPSAYERFLVPAFFVPCAERLLELAAITSGERVLDLACGTGVVAKRAARQVGAGGTVIGVDPNEGMLAVAASGSAEVVEWRVGGAEAVPLPDADVDVVCCQQGLQFFPDPAAAMLEVRRVLRPGGRLAIAVWRALEHQPVFVRLVEALDAHVGPEAAATMRGPFAGPDRDALRQLLSETGLGDSVVRIGVLAARFPSPREFLRQEVASSPLSDPVGALDLGRRDALTDQVDQALQPYVDDDGLVIPLQTWFVTATR